MSRLKQARNLLQTEEQRLQGQWALTSEQWRDVVWRRFEREYWREYEHTIGPVLQKVDKLSDIIAQARREIR